MSKIEQMQLKIAELLQANEAAMTLVNSLAAERDELAAQLVAVKEGGGTGQSPCRTYCESVATWKDYGQLRDCYDKLMNERNALAAQVELHKQRASKLSSLVTELIDHLRYNKAERDDVLQEFWGKEEAIAHVPSNPQQHLAEIRAEAGRAGFVEGFGATDEWVNGEMGTSDRYVAEMAESYAEQIRQGGK